MASSELTDQEKTQRNEANDNTEPNEGAENIINLVAARKLCDLKPKFMYNCLLVGVLISYGLAGGFVFKTFEAAPIDFEEKTEAIKATPSAEDLLNELLKTQNKNTEPFDEEWRRFAIAKIDEFVDVKTKAGQVELNPVEWSFADSWLFACTIFTTIGYGNIAPLSIKGRFFCMLFATIGIPLFSVVAGSLASFIMDLTRTLHAEYHRRKRRAQSAQQKKDDTSSPDVEGEVPELEITLKHVAMVCFGYLCLGSMFFSLGEGWSLFESFYYCFITLSTVGLGDYVPGHVHHTSLFGVYILVGLVLLIMLFGALEEVITKHCQKIKDKLKVVD
ncbi:potassium channel subfamily K member 18-like [Actinia tenebrosa]|uniref:Potassium channel subfamily K member 18-like n=1 Tax=Actinia tenebrosa TaxID=6105 RepID=A0A6P8H3V2_ACTTE|nr:potassium channel subfamily K member 18-like [Actinia tenebrosa]